jgi:hypothetical protein
MPLRTHFQATIWVWRSLTGRIARRVCVVLLLALLTTSAAARIHTFVLTRRIEAVIAGLSKLQIDRSTEEDVKRTVPYLVRWEWDGQLKRSPETGDIDLGTEQSYSVAVSNESSWMRFGNFVSRFSTVRYSKDGRPSSWILDVAELLGYRYIGFGARVVLLNGKVSSLGYGIADVLGFPRQLANIVSVRSAHAFWASHQTGFELSSTEEENPEFRVSGGDQHLSASYTPDATPSMTSHAFKVNLDCFWSVTGCRHAKQIAPLLWQDKLAVEAATLVRLRSNQPCPDRILAGRVKYLLDMNLLLLESTGFETKSVNEDGMRVDEIWTNYKQTEVLRGRSSNWWDSVRSSATIPYPGDYSRRLTNMGLHWADAGARVLAFSNVGFDSCHLVAAPPSALSTVRNTVPAPRRLEDELVRGLQ